MRFVLVDLDGASRDYFADRREVREALVEAEADFQGGAAELYVLTYDDAGNRLGDGIRGDEWLARRVLTGSSGTTIIGRSPRTKAVFGASNEPQAEPV